MADSLYKRLTDAEAAASADQVTALANMVGFTAGTDDWKYWNRIQLAHAARAASLDEELSAMLATGAAPYLAQFEAGTITIRELTDALATVKAGLLAPI